MTRSLAALVEATCGALQRTAVRITGAWQPRASLSGGWTRHEWHGVAVAAAPMVALVCARTGDAVAWHKSSPSKAPAEARAHAAATATPARVHEMALRLGVTVAPDNPLVGLDLHVQDAHASVTARALPGVSAGGAPVLDIPAERTTTTGVAFALACVPAAPEVVFSLLFIARAQVKMGRNHLWHVRRALAPLLGEPLRSVLARGRHGRLALDDRALRT